MMYPLVLDLAADKIPVAVTCRVLGFSKQAFYAWKQNPVSDRDWDDAHLINAAYAIHADDPEFGYRFICDELDLEHGIRAGENRVSRLCSQQGIWSVTVRRRGTPRRPGPAVHDDQVERDFTAVAPNQLWLTDITEHPTDEGKLYLCANRLHPRLGQLEHQPPRPPRRMSPPQPRDHHLHISRHLMRTRPRPMRPIPQALDPAGLVLPQPIMNSLPRNPEPGRHIGHSLTIGENRPNRVIPLLSHTDLPHPGSVTNQPKQL
jgi:HTH-like domain